MAEIRWERYPHAAELDVARAWLVLQQNLGLASNTIDAYGRALEEYVNGVYIDPPFFVSGAAVPYGWSKN